MSNALSIAYLVVGLIVWPFAAKRVWDKDRGEYGDPEFMDVVFSAFMGFCVAAFWPVVLPLYGLWVAHLRTTKVEE